MKGMTLQGWMASNNTPWLRTFGNSTYSEFANILKEIQILKTTLPKGAKHRPTQTRV